MCTELLGWGSLGLRAMTAALLSVRDQEMCAVSQEDTGLPKQLLCPGDSQGPLRLRAMLCGVWLGSPVSWKLVMVNAPANPPFSLRPSPHQDGFNLSTLPFPARRYPILPRLPPPGLRQRKGKQGKSHTPSVLSAINFHVRNSPRFSQSPLFSYLRPYFGSLKLL